MTSNRRARAERQDQSSPDRISIVSGALSDLAKSQTLVKRDGTEVGFAHLKKDLNRILASKSFQQRLHKRLSDARTSLAGFHRQIEDLAFIENSASRDKSRYLFILTCYEKVGGILLECLGQ